MGILDCELTNVADMGDRDQELSGDVLVGAAVDYGLNDSGVAGDIGKAD